MQMRTRAAHVERAVLDSAQGDQLIGQFAHPRGLAAHDDDFQAVVVIQVNVGGGDHVVVERVLDFGQLVLQLALVVVMTYSFSPIRAVVPSSKTIPSSRSISP